MEAELVAATQQLSLLKDGYSKARENLRAEQVVRPAGRWFPSKYFQSVAAELVSTARLMESQAGIDLWT